MPVSQRPALAHLRTLAAAAAGAARRHWLLTALLATGLVLRVLTQIAYQPAIFYIDSIKYLLGAYPGDDPVGYQLALKPLLLFKNLEMVVALQHLLGLAMAVTLYAVLLRRGTPRWLAALATAPILLDAYQLQIEQNVMPDVMFEALIVAGLAALLWQAQLSPRLVIIAGLTLGAAATARQVGQIFLLPALVFLMIVVSGWRPRLKLGALLCATFAIPILFASYANELSIHEFSLAPRASDSIYGRMAEAADCATLKLPSYERILCPSAALKSKGPDNLDHASYSPLRFVQPPPGMSHQAVLQDFVHRVEEQQPLNVVGSVAKAAMTLFAVDRNTSPGDTSIDRWQFHDQFWPYPDYISVQHGAIVFSQLNPQGQVRVIGSGAQFGSPSATVITPLATLLRWYQRHGGYTPGPLLLLMVLAGLGGSLAALRRRASLPDKATALACLLFFTSAVSVLLMSDVFEFSWRYQLPALVTLPPAGALAFALALRHLHRRHPATPEP